MDCEDSINESLVSLDVTPDRAQDFLAADAACVARLVALSDDCSSSMVRLARELLQRARQDRNEYKLQVLLRALFQRKHPQALDLIIEALVGPEPTDKETYMTFLLELDDPRVASTLVDFVASAPATNRDEERDDDGRVLAKAIDALRYYRVERATRAVLARLNDPASDVRRAVIEFLVELDARSAAPSLALQLEREDDPDNVNALIAGLVKWNHAAALPGLRRLLDGKWARGDDDGDDDESVRNALGAAIAALDAKPR